MFQNMCVFHNAGEIAARVQEIPEAVFYEFPAKNLRKLAVSDRNPP
jgi:hypothetical protein